MKAAIRKRFGTVRAFERAHRLPAKSVNDVLRGRASARVQLAIDTLVQVGANESRDPADTYQPKSRRGKRA